MRNQESQLEANDIGLLIFVLVAGCFFFNRGCFNNRTYQIFCVNVIFDFCLICPTAEASSV